VHYSERRLLTGVAGSMATWVSPSLLGVPSPILTPTTQAPEVLAKKGYTYTIDWWSLGVCAYELSLGDDRSGARQIGSDSLNRAGSA